MGDDDGRPARGHRCDAQLPLDLAQPVEHLARVSRALVRVLLRRPEHQLVDLLRHAWIAHARARHGIRGVLVGDLHGLLAAERLHTREHLVEHDAERVDVAAGVGHAARDQLGREVRDRSQQLRARCGVGACGAGEPEVADLDAPVLREQHVLRLDVAVDQAPGVCGGEPGEHSVHHGDRLSDGEALLLLEQIAQRDAWQVLHHQVRQLAVLTLVEHVHHVRVGQACS